MSVLTRGFTTLELVAVLTVISLLAAFAVSRFQSTAVFDVQSARDDVVAAFASAQQLSMVRSGGSESVQLQIHSNRVDVTLDGNSISIGGLNFPVTMPSGITLSASPVSSFSFNGLGNTSSSTVTVSHSSGGSVGVVVEDSGYAR